MMSQDQLEKDCVEAFYNANERDADRLLPIIREPADVRTARRNILWECHDKYGPP